MKKVPEHLLGKSIAVLPFVNMSADPENEYFSDGVTEEVINALTKIPGLKVIARTSSFAFKNKNVDVRFIGKQLGVRIILEGSIRKSRNKVRITAQLVRTDDGFHIWSQTFDRELEDIFALQDEISLLIADQIRENFGHLEIEEQLIDEPGISVEVYQLYLKGRYYFHKFNPDDIKRGIAVLEEVVTQQPDYALAYVNMHYGYNMLAAGGLMPVKEALTTGKQHLDKARQLDDELPECYHSLGWHSLNWDWDFINAVKYLQKAIELRPGYADAHQKLFITLALEGKLDAAHMAIQTAHQLDPLAPLNNYFMAYYHYLVEQFAESNHYMEQTFELDVSFIVGYSIYALSLVRQKRETYILEKAASIPEVEGAEVESLIMQTLAHSSLGSEDTKGYVTQLRAHLQGKSRERVRFFLIYVETILEQFESALDLIEAGVANREPLMTLLKVDPLLRPLHTFKRFQNALQTIYKLSDLQVMPAHKPRSSSLDDSEIAYYFKRLEAYMDEHTPFLQPNVSLRTLAKVLDIHPNKLSWLLNEHVGKNFNEYINHYRLNTFKVKALDPANSHLTLLGLAYESGFNSKTAFNAFFKKTEGLTPRAWLKSHRN